MPRTCSGVLHGRFYPRHSLSGTMPTAMPVVETSVTHPGASPGQLEQVVSPLASLRLLAPPYSLPVADYKLCVEVDNAEAGDWRYTVTALHVPYPNFPFTLAVGEAAAK